jgi:hypothetical protein
MAVLLLAQASVAFDGNRKGFVLGGGAGLAATANWKVETVDESGTGFALQFIIGGAFDEYNMLVYEGNVVSYNSDLADGSIAQGFNGASFYHYFGPPGKAAFGAVGIGLTYFKAADFDANDPGFGLLLGAGYEFAKHWQVAAYFSHGKSKEAGTWDYDHNHLSIIVSGVAF